MGQIQQISWIFFVDFISFVQLRLHHAQLHTVIIQHELFFLIYFGYLSDLHFFVHWHNKFKK